MSEKKKVEERFCRGRYTGNHPHIAGAEGVYYFNVAHDCELFRPDTADGNGEWYRVNLENIVDLEDRR